MELFYSKEVVKFLEKLDLQNHTRISRTRRLFETQGFNIGQQYIKKIKRLECILFTRKRKNYLNKI